MNKLLIISGPTATGKTTLAIKLAKKFNGELISADSRQVYRGMDIGTGKDHPKNVKIHLIDIINPSQSFSVAQYQKLAAETIQKIYQKNKLPIIVGGTGLYIDSIVNQKETFHIKPNFLLRLFLNHFPLKILQLIYKFQDKKSFENLNNSDKNNPRRLIRKIEISFSSKKIKEFPYLPARPAGGSKGGLRGDSTLHLSLTAPNSYLYRQIDDRVDIRFKNGLIDEIKHLLKKYKWSDSGFNTLAYKEFKPFFVETTDLASLQQKSFLQKCINRWRFDEHKYARRQKTWFKKRPNIFFFDVSKPGCQQKIFSLVSKWYN